MTRNIKTKLFVWALMAHGWAHDKEYAELIMHPDHYPHPYSAVSNLLIGNLDFRAEYCPSDSSIKVFIDDNAADDSVVVLLYQKKPARFLSIAVSLIMFCRTITCITLKDCEQSLAPLSKWYRLKFFPPL